MKVKRIVSILLATLMLAAVFVGCEPNPNGNTDTTAPASSQVSDDPFYGDDNISLKVWGPDAAVELLKKQCDAFIAQYPNKTIKIEVVAQGEADASTTMLNDPETAADVFGFACDQLDKLVTAGVISPVFDQANDIAGLDADKIKEMNSEGSVEAATIDGTLYAFPQTGDNGYMLFYNKEYVSDEQAKTLEGVLEACKAAGKKFILDAGNGFYSCMFAFTGGLKLEGLGGEDKDIQMFNEYDSDKVVASMKAFANLFTEYSGTIESAAVDKIIAGMEAGSCAAGIDGSWHTANASEVLGDNFGVAKLPTIDVDGTATQIVSMHGYKLIGVNKSTKHQDAAQLLAAYLTNEENQLLRAEEIMWGPSNKVAAESDTVKNNPGIAAILEQSNHSVAQVNIASTFWDPMANLGNKLYSKDEKHDDATLKKLLEDTIVNIKDE